MSRARQTTITADERVARLERDARALGIYVEVVAGTTRRVYLPDRYIEFRPGVGRGLWQVIARTDTGDRTEAVRTDAGMLLLLEKAIKLGVRKAEG